MLYWVIVCFWQIPWHLTNLKVFCVLLLCCCVTHLASERWLLTTHFHLVFVFACVHMTLWLGVSVYVCMCVWGVHVSVWHHMMSQYPYTDVSYDLSVHACVCVRAYMCVHAWIHTCLRGQMLLWLHCSNCFLHALCLEAIASQEPVQVCEQGSKASLQSNQLNHAGCMNRRLIRKEPFPGREPAPWCIP